MKNLSIAPWLALTLGAIALFPHPGFAQTQYQGDNPSAGPTGFQTNEQDPMKSLMGGGLNPLDLMHRAQTGRSRTGVDFAEDTQQGLSKAAADFKKQQQKLLQQTNISPSAGTGGTATPSPTP